MKKTNTLIGLLLYVLTIPVFGSSLSDTASQMQPGTWVELSGVDTAALHGNGSVTGEDLTYSHSGQWDAIGLKGYFIGTGHYGGADPRPPFLFRYTVATNRWEKLADLGPLGAGPGHNYDHTSIDPEGRKLYHRSYGSDKVYGWNTATDTWLGLLTTAPYDLGNVAEGTAWFNGSFMVYSGEMPGGTSARFWNPSQGSGSSAWSAVNNVLTPGPTSSNYHTWAEYSKVYGVAFMGGGNNQPRKVAVINADRTVTAVPDAPIDIRIQGANAVADPVSGKLLVYGNSQLWQLARNGAAWAWTRLPDPPANIVADSGLGNPSGSSAARSIFSMPIDTYGVVMYVRCQGDNPCRTYLYKNAASGPPPPNQPPTISITSPTTSASFIAPASIAFTLSATDDGSVAKVEFFANGSLIGTNSVAPFGFTWAGVVLGDYVITAKATDNLGLSTTSAPVNVKVCSCSALLVDGACSGCGEQLAAPVNVKVL